MSAPARWPEARQRKFRQAAFVYLHVAILYEAAAFGMLRAGLLPTRVGPPVLWLVLGGLVGLGIVAGLWHWQNHWFTRAVWAIHGLRVPALVNGAFFRGTEARLPTEFYLTALVIVLVNLWMLARAGWDL